MSGLVFGMDIGGSSIKLGAWDGTERRAWQTGLPVPDVVDQDTVVAAIAGYIGELAGSEGRPDAIGIGSCGVIRDGIVFESPNTVWDRLELVPRLQALKGYTAFLANDADAFLAGAMSRLGLTERSAIGITLGTGVGTSFRLEGRIIASGRGINPHAGHITINYEGGIATTGIPGTFEYYCGIAGLLRCYGAAGGDVTPREIADRAAAGEQRAIDAWNTYGGHAGVGLASLCNVFMPEVVVIGGGLALANAHFAEALDAKLNQHMMKSIPRPQVTYIEDQPDLVAWGAAVLAREARQ
jgi:glucokinase